MNKPDDCDIFFQIRCNNDIKNKKNKGDCMDCTEDEIVLKVPIKLFESCTTFRNLILDLYDENIFEDGYDKKNIIEKTKNIIPLENNINASTFNIIKEFYEFSITHEKGYDVKSELNFRKQCTFLVCDFPLHDWEIALFDKINNTKFGELFHTINYLEYTEMIFSCEKYVGFKLKGKNTKEIRDMLNLEDDFSDAEKYENTRKYGWCNQNEINPNIKHYDKLEEYFSEDF